MVLRKRIELTTSNLRAARVLIMYDRAVHARSHPVASGAEVSPTAAAAEYRLGVRSVGLRPMALACREQGRSAISSERLCTPSSIRRRSGRRTLVPYGGSPTLSKGINAKF